MNTTDNENIPNQNSIENPIEIESTYSDESFWEKIKNFSKAAGREPIQKVLTAYYCAQDPDTPKI